METAQVKTRPFRFAFLVEPKDKKSLLRTFEVTSSLWGGVFNFIIPLFKIVPARYKQEYQKPISAKAMLNGFVEAFQPDYVVESRAGQCKEYGIDFPEKRTTSFTELLSRDDLGRCQIGVDLRSICHDLYEEKFQFVQRHPPEVVIPSCKDKRFNLLFAAMFGSLPEKGELAETASIYLHALDGKRKSYEPTEYPEIFQKSLFPIRVTRHKLETYRNSHSWESHLFYMDETSPCDLIEYWNYRALGWKIIPFPARLAPQLVDFANKFIAEYLAIFCGPRTSEAMGLQWKSWTGEALMPHGTAYEGRFYKGRLKTKASKAPIPVPEPVRPVIEAWRRICKDSSPEALMFPTFGRGDRKGQAVPRDGKNFLRCRIRPVSRKLGIPDRLVTFQVMRRTMGTDMQHHGTLKDTQGALRHVSIKTTGDVYVQILDESVARAVSSRTAAVLGDWTAPAEKLGLKGRNLKSVPVETLDAPGQIAI